MDGDNGGKRARVSEKIGHQRGIGRRHLLGTAVTGTSLSLAGCLSSTEILGGTDDDEPIKIGVLAPNPGSNFTGQSILRGAEVGVDKLNEEGGILGRDVELVLGDTNASPLEVRRQYQRLVLQEGVDVTIGVAMAEVLEALMPDLAEQQTLHLTTGSVSTKVSQQVKEEYETYKYHFRVGPNNDHDMGQIQIDFLDDMADEIGWNSLAVLAEDYAWTENPWNVYRNQLPDVVGDVVIWDQYPPSTDDFSTLYDEVEARGADAVHVSAAHTGNDLMMDWSTAQRNFAFGGNHVPMQNPSYYELTDGACEYGVSYTSATEKSELTEKTQPFVDRYRDAYDGSTPLYSGYTTFDAIELFGAVVEEAQTLDSEELVTALEETTFTGTTGTIEFHDPNHDYAHDVIYGEDYVQPVVFQWQAGDDGGGVQEVIWPEEYATADYVEPRWIPG